MNYQVAMTITMEQYMALKGSAEFALREAEERIARLKGLGMMKIDYYSLIRDRALAAIAFLDGPDVQVKRRG